MNRNESCAADSILLIFMKNLLSWILILSCVGPVYGRRTVVTAASGINSGSWGPGDTIVMKNMTWNNQVISLKATGNEANPVVLEAETPGEVILSGNSRLSFSGKYIVVSGLYFLNGTLSGSDVISFRTSSSQLAENCRLTGTAIVNYNPDVNTVDSKWVSIYGKNNRVDHCSFENKNNSGTLMVVWLISNTAANHVIADNYFGYRNANLDAYGKELNGQEILRVGDSNTSMTTAGVRVEGNFFERCNGEIEVISNKSCGNLYVNNLFYECKGMLTLRHGNNCTVEGNYFFGNGISSSGGVRIIGENHKVFNNYFQDLKGTNFRSAICMVRGKANSALNEYFQVKNALVAFNTMVNCSQAFSINYNSTQGMTLPPVTSVIAHNHVYNTSASNTNVVIDQTHAAGLDVTWKNNLMNQGKYGNFSFVSAQVVTGVDPGMAPVPTALKMFEPGSGSALINYVTPEFPAVTTDIRGRTRAGQAKWPGCSQPEGDHSLQMPEKKLSGASFFNNPSTGWRYLPGKSFPGISVDGNLLTLNPPAKGDFSIFHISGSFISRDRLQRNEHKTYSLKKGVYLVLFENGDSRFTGKVLIF